MKLKQIMLLAIKIDLMILTVIQFNGCLYLLYKVMNDVLYPLTLTPSHPPF